jgi:large subunit ribosomal protein L2
MALKVYKPTSPGTRGLILVDKSSLWKGRPMKELTEGLIKTGGRNNHGHITTRHIGGGHKRRYRLVDFKRLKDNIPAKVERIEYDPNRTAFVALIKYNDGEYSYILAPQRLSIGDEVSSGANADIKPGNCLEMKRIPVGTIVHNVEIKPQKGGQVARSAGSYAQIVGRDAGYIMLRLSSGELRRFHGDCRATVGAVSNPDQKNINLGKAGRSRNLGVRPTVRGIAMNPVDHPHGGRTNGGRHPVTPWGIATKGKKTRGVKPSDKYIVRRRTK